jgi:dihydroxy-acid dehydratase
MLEFARISGRRIVELVLEDIKPRYIMTVGAFRNAVAAVLAVSGSINCVKHLQAIAVESGVRLDVFNLFNELGETIPVLSAVRPNGEDTIESFEAAGGARAIMKQLEPLLDLDVLTVTGRSVRENLSTVVVQDAEIIRPISRPFSNKAPIVILHGSLAPESAIVKLGLRGPDRATRFTGKAIVYENAPAAIRGIKDGEVRPGHALVVRGMGLKGGPGMAGPASHVVFALDAAGLQSEVAYITDGQLSGLCNKGLTVAEVSPESAVGGPISLAVNGDRITIDVDQRILNIDVSEAELAARRARLGDPVLPKATGYLSIYQRTVQPMSAGAVLVCETRDENA